MEWDFGSFCLRLVECDEEGCYLDRCGEEDEGEGLFELDFGFFHFDFCSLRLYFLIDFLVG